MRDVNPDRYFNPNEKLIEAIEVRSQELYELLLEIINNEPNLDASNPINSIDNLKQEIRAMDIDKVGWLVEQINMKL